MAHPPYSPDPAPGNFFVSFPRWQKVLKGKCFANVEEVEEKTAETLKGIKIYEFKTVLSSGKCLNRCIASNGEYFEGDWSLNMEE